jgi:uncharacterized protein (TIGR03437 family)
MVRALVALLALGLVLSLSGLPPRLVTAGPSELQLTSSAISHLLDNNDNFSKDNRFLCFDTRDTVGTGIGNGTAIMKVDLWTSVESLIYAPDSVIVGSSGSAPGLGAVSFSPVADEVVFIHGPFVSEIPALGAYGTTNRRGAVVPGDGSGKVKFLDMRDVTSAVTTPGAHRGGSHRHEYSLDGKRVGFTYDDALLTPAGYGRTLGFMAPHPKAPAGATHYAALLVPIVPANTAKPGELERGADDSWIGAKGLMRGFIGTVKQQDGSYMSSLFVVDIPEDVDVTTADSGTTTRFPGPPKGTAIRRLTHTAAAGIVRGSHDGAWVGYYATAADGSRQVFIIPSKGSDLDPDPAMRPVQATFLDSGASGGLRWHPSGNSIAVLSDNGVAVTCVKPGPLFGASYFLTPHGASSPAPEALVWSRDGALLAYNRRVPTFDAKGNLVKDAGGNDFRQIFLTAFPDSNNNGIADPIEAGVVRNAASFVDGKVAPQSWASFFGSNLAGGIVIATTTPLPTSLGGVSVDVTCGGGTVRPAMLQMVSPEQINFLVPTGRLGLGSVTVTTADGRKLSVPVQHEAVAPGLFSANSNGKGVAAAVAVRIAADGKQTSQVIFQCTGGAGTCTATPISAGSASDQVILLLYGTGIRGFTSGLKVTIGGQAAEVVGAAAQSQYAGLDQINVRVAPSMAGKGEVPILVTVDGKRANAVTVNIR